MPADNHAGSYLSTGSNPQMTDIFIMMGFLTMVLAPCMIALHRGANID